MGNWRITIEGTGPHHNGVKAIVKYPDGHEAEIIGGLKIEGPVGSSFYVDKDGVKVELVRWEDRLEYDADVVFRKTIDYLKRFQTIHSAKIEILGQIDYANVQKFQDLSGKIPA